MLRIKTSRAQYWKLENLEDFDGQRWVMRGVPDPFGPDPEADLEQSWTASPQWTGHARITVRGLRGDQYAGAGTTVSVDAGPRQAIPTFSPGTWQADRDSGQATHTRSSSTRRARTCSSCRPPTAARAASRATHSRRCSRSCAPSCPTPETPAAAWSRRSSSSCARSTSSARRWLRTSAAAPRGPASLHCATRPTGARGSSPSS